MKVVYFRSDFADELIENVQDTPYFTLQKRTYKKNVITNHIKIIKYHREIKKPKGDYISINFPSLMAPGLRKDVENILVSNLKTMLEKYQIDENSRILIAGLGNKEVTADSLGPYVASHIKVSAHLDTLKAKVAVLAPGVMGQTGLETSDIIKAVVKTFKPHIIIVVDALATLSIQRINKSIQLNDTGITPGSGVGNHRKSINIKTMGIPVIAVGVATVVDATSIVNETIEMLKEYDTNLKIKNQKGMIYDMLEERGLNMVVTPKSIDEETENLANLIGRAINRSLNL